MANSSSLVLMLLLLLLVVVVFLFLIMYQRKKTQGGGNNRGRKNKQQRQKELDQEIQNHKDNLKAGAAKVGIDKDDVENIILGDSNVLCLVSPDADTGTCRSAFYDLKDGCCKLRDTSSQEAAIAQTKMYKDLGLKLGALLVSEIIITSILPKIGARIVGFTSAQLAKAVAKTAAITASRMALTGANFAGRILFKLGAGPVGWALLVFDIISVTLDLADLRNYDSFIENKGLMESRDILIYKFQEAVINGGGDYPMLFPYSSIFPDESNVASEEMITYMFTNHTEELLEVDGGEDYLVELLISALGAADEDGPIEDSQSEDKGLEVVDIWMKNVRKEHGKELDKYMFEILQDEIPESKRKDIYLVPSMSTETSAGISISEEAAIRWNEENKEEWYKYNDPFYPVNTPEAEYIPPYTAIHTNQFLKLNEITPGTDNRPNLIYENLPQKVTLCYPFGPLVASCEKSRTSAQHKEEIDPKDFGVSFNYQNGVCQYTKDYCDRYVIDYKNNTWGDGTPYKDCSLSKDQEWAETFLGTNVVRNAKRYFDDPSNAVDDWDQLYKDRKEKHGEAGAIALFIVDPLGISEAGEGMVAGWKEKMAGKDKFCRTGDTCKFFTAKHDGGNFMTWTARDSDGLTYPHPLLSQGQVKVGEDHTFYVPEGGSFRVKCDPGEGKNFSYGEIPDNGRKDFTCWNGKVNKPYNPADTVDAAVDAAEDFVEDSDVSVGDDGVSADTPVGGGSVDSDGACAYGIAGGVCIDRDGIGVETPVGDVTIPSFGF